MTAEDRPAAGSRLIPRHLDNPTDRGNLALLLCLFVALTLTTYVVGWIAWKQLGLAEGTPEVLVHSIFDRWDVLNYVIISEEGYRNPDYVVWFPSLPLVMHAFAVFGVPEWLSGTIVILTCTAAVTAAFYTLARLDFDAKVSRDATIFLLIFPSSFFLFVPYTEAMLLLLAVLSFYFARTGHWIAACLVAGLATGIRLTGLCLGPALLIEYLNQRNWSWREVRSDIAWLVVVPTGLTAYMTYLWIKFNDPMDYFHAQRDFPRLETITTRGAFHFPLSLIDEVRVIFLSHSTSEQVQNGAGLAGVIVLTLLFALMLRYRLRWSYIVYSALAGVMPLLVGRLESQNRYMIGAFPIFLVLGELVRRYPLLKAPLWVACLGLFFLSAVRFATFNWAG